MEAVFVGGSRGGAPILFLLSLVISLVVGLTSICSGQKPVDNDSSQVSEVPRAEIDDWLKKQVKENGGNWDRDRYHYYIGFSTGHIGNDPASGAAMRRLAFSMVNNSLAAGDRVTPIAWEMQTWDVGPNISLTDDPDTRKQFANRVPYTPRSGSKGGHDIERTLYETVTKSIPPGETASSIVLLFTNNDQSQSPIGSRADLFGEDNPKLIEALKAAGYPAKVERKAFQLKGQTKEGQPRSVNIAIAAIFPKRLVSIPYSPVTARVPFPRESWQPSADQPIDEEKLPNEAKGVAANVPPAAAETTTVPEKTGPRTSNWLRYAAIALAIVALLLVVMYYVRAKAAIPTAAASVPARQPQSRPIPGSLTISIGQNEHILQPLTADSQFIVQRDAAGAVTIVNPAAPPKPGEEVDTNALTLIPIAKLAFDGARQLCVSADSGAQFVDLNGPDPSKLDSRTMTIAPGTKAFCRIIPGGSTAKTRFEVAYNTIQKGNRA